MVPRPYHVVRGRGTANPAIQLGPVAAGFRALVERIRASRRRPSGRARIEALPLWHAEPDVRPLPISMDAPRALALRRIHIVNRGTGTVLGDWEVWISLPDQRRPRRARVVSPSEWASMDKGARHDRVPVLCSGDVLHAPKGRRIRGDIPFLVEGMLPDEILAGDIEVRVVFRDRANRSWTYDRGAAMAITGDRSVRSVGASPIVAWRAGSSRAAL